MNGSIQRAVPVLPLLVAAALGCGAERPDGDEQAVVGERAAATLSPPPPPPAAGAARESAIATALTPKAATAEVKVEAAAEDGASYVAGLFRGAITLGGARLASRGGEDVFLARIERDGRVAWALSVGSRAPERDPGLMVEDGRIQLMAVTRGEVDCGDGPLVTWSSEAFFLCVFAPDGRPVEGGTFPTGRP
jgi:hypothetical protein